MQLGIRFLNVVDINHYSMVPYAQFNQGQDFDLYFQLVDLSQVTPVPYIPGVSTLTGASGSVTFAGLTAGSAITATIAGIAFGQAFDTDNDTTVASLVDLINASGPASALVVASSSGGILSFQAPAGLGALPNNFPYTGSVVSGAGTATALGSYLTGGVGAGSALMRAEVLNINDANVVTRYCTQPFSGVDASIWKLSILNTDPIQAGTANLRLTLIEGSRQSFIYSQGGCRVYSTSQSSTQPGGASGPFGYAAQGL